MIIYRSLWEKEIQVCHKIITEFSFFSVEYRYGCTEAVLSGVVLEVKGEIHCACRVNFGAHLNSTHTLLDLIPLA
jgi:hypothetical protein